MLCFSQSKYIAALKEKAEQRKREQDIIYERKLQKERSKEDHLYGDKDKFVTSAYRKKLEEERKWLEEEKRRQLQEEKEDVSFSQFFFMTLDYVHVYLHNLFLPMLLVLSLVRLVITKLCIKLDIN